jgi:hypothetical protein
MDKKETRGEKEREKGGKEKGKGKGKNEKRKGQFGHFTTSIQQVKPFCQTFFKTAPAPSAKPLHERRQSQSCF